MKDTVSGEHDTHEDEILPEYIFERGTRGKHAKGYRKGYRVEIRGEDGKLSVTRYKFQDGDLGS